MDRAILNEAQYCLHAMLNHGSLSARRVVLRPNPVYLYSWQDNDSNSDFVRNTSIPPRTFDNRRFNGRTGGRFQKRTRRGTVEIACLYCSCDGCNHGEQLRTVKVPLGNRSSPPKPVTSWPC